MERFAVFIDLATIRLGANMMRKIHDDLTKRGSIEYIKLYNYNTRRHREFGSLVKEYHAKVELPLLGKKRVRIDIREVIDAIKLASQSNDIDTFFFICSEVDSTYLLSELRSMGKKIILGVTSSSSLEPYVHEIYMIDRAEELKDEVAICALDDKETLANSKVKGKEDSVFPYSDIEMEEINDKMAKIDKCIVDVLSGKIAYSNLHGIFGDKS